MEDKFISVWSTDREIELFVNNEWNKDIKYYLYKGNAKTIEGVILNSLTCKFVTLTQSGKLIFMDNIGLKIEVDVRDKETRRNLKIMPEDLNSDVSYDCEPVLLEWYIERSIVFDTKFFKLGHCYMVREKRNEDPKPMMLIEMDFDGMRFLYVTTDTSGMSLVEYLYISTERYNRMKNTYWFKPMMEGDVWSDDVHKEMAENE